MLAEDRWAEISGHPLPSVEARIRTGYDVLGAVPVKTAKDHLLIGPELAGTLMTVEEFDAARDWEEGYRYELIHGVLVVTPPPSAGERGPNDLLGHLLREYQENHPRGSSLDSTLTEHTVATPRSRRRADRVVWVGLGRRPDVRRDTPAVVIEFVSSRRRDRLRDYETKREEYREAGVAEYWIVDRFRRRLTAVRYSSSPSELVVGEKQTYTTELLPGFELPLERLLAEADWLTREEMDA